MNIENIRNISSKFTLNILLPASKFNNFITLSGNQSTVIVWPMFIFFRFILVIYMYI